LVMRAGCVYNGSCSRILLTGDLPSPPLMQQCLLLGSHCCW